MKQYTLEFNTLNLKVKKSPLIIRFIMFLLAFSFFTFPLLGVIFSVANGAGMQIGYFLAIGLFGVVGFYLLRVSLWNTYGEETIDFLSNKIIYEANYGWFKDAKKEIELIHPQYSHKSVGYEEDNEAVLIITCENAEIETAVKMPLAQIEELILILQNSKMSVGLETVVL
ncbi:hypothetical protein [Flavobacterium defluvii]|uniref:Uncharacterized protein n=1 Tax=Flavobacterium defluvii TaxID=370979 RepID=A0A1M5VHS0_9FLAO|nr:hypothetical protein [Flavobacterium defluvii]SHH74777.1 hypothetical protein SAMN05443663_1119 [Flavobacterium defluvii]